MIVYAERQGAAVLPPVLPAAQGKLARALALAFLRFASASWRGESTSEFATRLGSYWQPELPPKPADAPDAYSPHGASGRGIAWYEMNGEVLGFSGGGRRGYRIPSAAVPGLVHAAPIGQRATVTIQASAQAQRPGRCAA